MDEGTRDETTRRKERLAEQLRANLKRRKEQTRARRADAPPQDREPDGGNDVSG